MFEQEAPYSPPKPIAKEAPTPKSATPKPDTNANREGYKLTKLGWMPEEWEVKFLKEVSKIGSGTTPSKEIKRYWENGTIPWLPTGKVNDKIITESETFITEAAVKEKRIKLLPIDSVVIAMIGQGKTRGKTALLKIEAWINQNFAFVVPKTTLAPEYLFRNLDFSYKRIRYEGNRGGNQGSLNTGMVRFLRIAVPPLPEQRAIADCLSTWDQAIQTLTQLIAQKELRKKWLMQQLLTGKKRLPGFGGEWKNVKISDLFEEVKAKNDGGEHEPLTISAKSGFVSQRKKFDRVIAGDSLAKYTQLVRGDFAYNKGNSKLYEMGCLYPLEDRESALVPFVYICFRAKNKDINGGYYKYWFENHGLDHQLGRIITSGARGDGLLNVNKKDFFSLKIPHTSMEEQTAIAQILQRADQEITLLNQKLIHLQDQKKGLMQQLLTGKKRLNLNNKQNGKK